MGVLFDINEQLIMNNLQTTLEDAGYETLEKMLQDIEPYVPYKTGELNDSAIIDESSMDIVWDADYAEYVYDLPKDSNFNKEVHPLATSDWVNEAMQSYESKWVEDFKQLFRNKG